MSERRCIKCSKILLCCSSVTHSIFFLSLSLTNLHLGIQTQSRLFLLSQTFLVMSSSSLSLSFLIFSFFYSPSLPPPSSRHCTKSTNKVLLLPRRFFIWVWFENRIHSPSGLIWIHPLSPSPPHLSPSSLGMHVLTHFLFLPAFCLSTFYSFFLSLSFVNFPVLEL